MTSRIAVDVVILTLFLTLSFNNDNVYAFTSRSPLSMGISNNNGGDEIDSFEKKHQILVGNTSLSIASSPSPLASINNSSNEIGNNPTKAKSIENRKIYRRKGRPNNNRNTKVASPLVDSTLLRFLSAQKNQIAAQESISEANNREINSNITNNNKGSNESQSYNNNEEADFVNSTRSTYFKTKSLDLDIESIMESSNLIDETELIKSMTDNLMINDNGTNNDNNNSDKSQDLSSDDNNNGNNKDDVENKKILVTKESSISQVKDTTADSISWFTQYNAHHVARKLINLGSSIESAQEAGNAVQNYALMRTTLQRVRKFLSQRDSIIYSASFSPDVKDGGNANNNNNLLSSNQDFTITAREQNYNIHNIIEVLTDAGLTGKDIAALFTHTPSVSMMQARNDGDNVNSSSSNGDSLETTLNRAYFGVLCSSIRLRKCDARKVIRTCPGLLTKSGSTSSEEVISILSNLGVAPTSLCRDKAALPILLSRSPASLFRLVAFLSSDAVRMPVEKIGPLFRRSECASLLDFVAPLSNHQIVDSSILSDNFLLKGAGENNAMETEITRRYKMMFKTAKHLRRVVGMKDLGRSISAYASILTLEIDSQIDPCITFLIEEVGLYEEEIPNVLELYPQLLGANIAEMQNTVEYLKKLEVLEEDLGSIFRAFPALLTLHVSDMDKVVEFLKAVGVSNIGRFVTRLPPVLGYSVANDLLPKWKYLSGIRNYASFEISRFPAYFSYPLDRIIRNRFDYLLEVKHIPVQFLPVDEVLRYGDKDFAILVAKDDDEKSYLSFVEKRKISRQNRKQTKKQKMRTTDIR